MKFKNLPYWSTAGIIAGILFISLFILSLFLPKIWCNSYKPLSVSGLYENCVPVRLSDILLMPNYIPLDILDINNDYLTLAFAFVFSLIVYFVVEALVGMIIGKVKLRVAHRP